MNIPRTTAGWIRYFEWNAQNLLPVDWQDRSALPEGEFRILAASLPVFQLGESSDGNSLRRAARVFSTLKKEEHLEKAISLFIAEETRHAKWLGTYMDAHKIPRARQHWSDHVFRRVRKFGGFPVYLYVLLTAELVARVYYHALFRATTSPLLRQICRQLLRDEVFHVYFHTQLLRKVHEQHATIAIILWTTLYRLFHKLTLSVVWMGHGSVLRKGGFSFSRYWRKSDHYCEQALARIRSANDSRNCQKGEKYAELNVENITR